MNNNYTECVECGYLHKNNGLPLCDCPEFKEEAKEHELSMVDNMLLITTKVDGIKDCIGYKSKVEINLDKLEL